MTIQSDDQGRDEQHDQHRDQGTGTGLLLLAVLITFSAQQVLMPALAPFARETGLSETQLGSVIGIAAGILVLAAPLWARTCAHQGPRAILVTGLLLTLVGSSGFALVATAALDDQLSGGTTFALVLLTRGLIFGAGLAAVPVAALAFVAAATSGAERTAGIAKVGGVQGAAVVVGPAVGTVAAFAGLLGPLWVAPLFVLLALVLVVLRLPRTRPTSPPGSRVRLRPWDPRLRSFLLLGLALYTSLGLVLLTLGFAMQDRGGLDPAEAARATGAATVACGVVLGVVQGVLVPRLDLSPRALILLGAPIAAVGLVCLAVAGGALVLGASMVVVGLGMGLASPGYMAGPSLAVADDEQPAVAGLLTATNGLAFVIGPTAGGALYALAYPLPFVVAAVITATGVLVVLMDRRTTERPSPDRPATDRRTASA